MKKLLFICLLCYSLVSLTACNQNTPAADAKVDSTANKNTEVKAELKDSVYGVPFDPSSPEKLVDLMKDPSKLDTTKEYTVEASVTEVCQVKGCWFRAEDGKGGDVFVKIITDDSNEEEVGIPMKTAAGTNIIFRGKPKHKEVSVKQQRHYLEDAGKSKEEINAITKPKMEWRFMATGVIVKG